MRCTEPGRSPAQIVADWLAGGQTPSLGQDRQTIFTQSGRAAIALAARLWGISSDDDVLIPAYHCGSEVSPLIATGARIVMYRVDGHAELDLEDVLQRVTARTRLILVIHYFGQPTDVARLAAFCRARNIKLLEDCALSLFSHGVGRLGDGAIYSFYKTLPTCAGGALTLRHTFELGTLPPAPVKGGRDALSLVKKWATGYLPRLPLPASRLPVTSLDHPLSLPDMPAAYYHRQDMVARSASRIALGAIRRADAAAIRRARRDNYAALQRRLLQVPEVTLLWRHLLAEDTCPLGLPILVRNKPYWCARLMAAGIAASPWWSGFHRGLDWSGYPDALALKARLILLPVHQNLSAKQVDHIAQTVASIAASAHLS